MNEVQSATEQRAEKAPAQHPVSAPAVVYTPLVDVLQGSDAVTVVVDLPGVRESDIEITVKQHTLSLVARRDAIAKEGLRRLFSEGELRPVEYRRVFTLSDRIDAERIEATSTNGTLRLTIPMREEAKPRRVAVQAAG